jgi:hypothetical protein
VSGAEDPVRESVGDRDNPKRDEKNEEIVTVQRRPMPPKRIAQQEIAAPAGRRSASIRRS